MTMNSLNLHNVVNTGAANQIKPEWVSEVGSDANGFWFEFMQQAKCWRISKPHWSDEFHYDSFGLYTNLTVKGVTQCYRWIPPGEFWMGSPITELSRIDNEIQHAVTLTEGFWLADTVCTQALWMAMMTDNPACFTDHANYPVEQVSWDDVQQFFKRLNASVSGLGAHLPTEAQWEYACRAGTQTAFAFGETIASEQINFDGQYAYAGGYPGICRDRTVAVKSLPANAWGLYEMHGNVWEWCSDWYDDYTVQPVINPTGSETGSSRVLRGGAWCNQAWRTRSANRGWYVPVNRDNYIGFRIAINQNI